MKKKEVHYIGDYKKQLAEFMETINPKPTIEQIERLRKQLIEKRGN